MQKKCDHNIPETRKGAGDCDIRAEVKKRNGKPHWWCHTHGYDASAPDGAPVSQCEASWFDPPPDEMRLEVELDEGEQIAVWGALTPALSVGSVPPEKGSVHVHRRVADSTAKTLDASFEILTVTFDEAIVVIEGMAAKAFSISQIAGVTTSRLSCPQCGDDHIDEQKFAVTRHKKHQCNRCGRAFFDSEGTSVSNPLSAVHEQLGLPEPPPPVRAPRDLDLVSKDYSGLAMWPSNRAVLNTMVRPEEEGIHVHAWDHGGVQVVDETYSTVKLDGVIVDENALRALTIQREVTHDPLIESRPCSGCGATFVSPTEGWVEPTTTHTCPTCSAVTKTRRRVFLNPLAPKAD